MVAGFGATSIINYIFALSMGWLLRPGDYGLLSFSQTLILLTALILNSGIAWSLTATLAQTTPDKHAAYIRGAYLGNLGLAILLSVIIGILFATGSLTEGFEDWRIVFVVLSAIPFLAAVAVANAAFRGRQRFMALAFNQVLEIMLKASAGIILVLCGAGVVGAIVGFLVGAMVSAIVSGWRTMHVFGEPLIGPVAWPNRTATADMFAALLGMAVILNLDIIMLKLLGVDRALTGIYQAAIVLANTPYYLATALLAVLFAQLARERNFTHRADYIAKMLRNILIYLTPFELVLVLVPKSVLMIVFPASYASAASILPFLAIGNSALMLLATFATAFQATGKARISAKMLLMTISLEFISLVIFVPSGGAVAAALGFSAACFSALIVHAAIYVRAIEDIDYRLILNWALRYVACLMVAMFSVVALLKLTDSLWVILSVSTLFYLAALIISGLINFSKPRRHMISLFFHYGD